jgi:hypothetical protein
MTPMTEQVTTSETVVNRSAVAAVFLMVLGLTYSDDVVEFVSVLTGHGPGFHHGIVFLVDCLLVLAAAVLKWRIMRRVDPAAALGRREFMPVLLRSWWAVGAALLVAVHVVTAVLGLSLGVKLVGSAFFAVAMGLVLVGALDTTGTRAGAAANGWIVPLVTGTLVVQTATALWFDVISIAGDCADEIATDFFAQMVQVIPLLLITLGLEMNVLRRNRALHTPGQYAAPVLTVLMLCLAELLAFSMLVAANRIGCGVAAVWHEYVAFAVCVQATSIALATVVWLLLVPPPATTDHP